MPLIKLIYLWKVLCGIISILVNWYYFSSEAINKHYYKKKIMCMPLSFGGKYCSKTSNFPRLKFTHFLQTQFFRFIVTTYMVNLNSDLLKMVTLHFWGWCLILGIRRGLVFNIWEQEDLTADNLEINLKTTCFKCQGKGRSQKINVW